MTYDQFLKYRKEVLLKMQASLVEMRSLTFSLNERALYDLELMKIDVELTYIGGE